MNFLKKALVITTASITCLGLAVAPAQADAYSNRIYLQNGSAYRINVWSKPWCTGTHRVLNIGDPMYGVFSTKVNAYSWYTRDTDGKRFDRPPNECMNVNTGTWDNTLTGNYPN
jgi:hypothetical protein